MKILLWIFRATLYLSITIYAVIVFTSGGGQGFDGLSNAFAMVVSCIIGGFSLIALIVIGIINYLQKNKIYCKKQDIKEKNLNTIKIIIFLVVLGIVAILIVPAMIWAVGSFNSSKAICTKSESGLVICR